jgi:hypothetical protein
VLKKFWVMLSIGMCPPTELVKKPSWMRCHLNFLRLDPARYITHRHSSKQRQRR